MKVLEGSVVGNGKYLLGSLLKAGGQAEVWSAKQLGVAGFEKEVALKIVHLEGKRKERDKELLLREATVTSSLNHPNLVKVYSAGYEDDIVYLAMEWVHGMDLDQLEKRFRQEYDTPMKWPIAAQIIIEICKGLEYVHSLTGPDGHQGLIHRDLKTENVMLSENGYVKIIDFGVAKTTKVGDTTLGKLKGTPNFMSPEQIGQQPVDFRSDLFSLGAIFYTLCTGRKPFFGSNFPEILFAVISRDPEPVSTYVPDFPAEIEEIIFSMLEKDREKRISSAFEIRKRLETFLREENWRVGTGELYDFYQELLGVELDNQEEDDPFDDDEVTKPFHKPDSYETIAPFVADEPENPEVLLNHQIIPEPLGRPSPEYYVDAEPTDNHPKAPKLSAYFNDDEGYDELAETYHDVGIAELRKNLIPRRTYTPRNVPIAFQTLDETYAEQMQLSSPVGTFPYREDSRRPLRQTPMEMFQHLPSGSQELPQAQMPSNFRMFLLAIMLISLGIFGTLSIYFVGQFFVSTTNANQTQTKTTTEGEKPSSKTSLSSKDRKALRSRRLPPIKRSEKSKSLPPINDTDPGGIFVDPNDSN